MFLQKNLLNLHQWCDENKMNFKVWSTKPSEIAKSNEAKTVRVCILNGEDIFITQEASKVL